VEKTIGYVYWEAHCKNNKCGTRILVWADNKAYDRSAAPYPVPQLFLNGGGIARTCLKCLQRYFYRIEDCDYVWKQEAPADML